MNLDDIDFSKIDYSKYEEDIKELQELCHEIKNDKKLMKKLKKFMIKTQKSK